MKNLLRLIILISLPAVCSAQSTAPEALAILDRVVKGKQQITQTKLDLIARTKEQFSMAKSKERQYKLIDEIYEEYRVFNLDSAEVFASKQLTLAKALNNTEYINHSILTLAEVYATEGLYLEALNLANSVNRHSLNADNLKYCYHVYRMMYGFMADYSSKKSFHNEYVRQVSIYRDSLMLYQGKNTSSYAISKSEKLLDKGHYKEALNLMLPWVKKSDMDMDAFQFIKEVAIDWDDTKYLEAEPGRYITVARKAKGTGNWFIGGITGDNTRTSSFALSFLDPGKKYTATLYCDGKDADYLTNPESYQIKKMTVTSKTKISVKLARSGGFAMSIFERK